VTLVVLCVGSTAPQGCFLNNSVTLTRYRPTPWGWSVKIETCQSTFKYFYIF